jgi:hypothetical protein
VLPQDLLNQSESLYFFTKGSDKDPPCGPSIGLVERILPDNGAFKALASLSFSPYKHACS